MVVLVLGFVFCEKEMENNYFVEILQYWFIFFIFSDFVEMEKVEFEKCRLCIFSCKNISYYVILNEVFFFVFQFDFLVYIDFLIFIEI